MELSHSIFLCAVLLLNLFGHSQQLLYAPTRSMLVRPVLREETWASVVEQDKYEKETADNEIYNIMVNDLERLENALKKDEPRGYTACSVGIYDDCPQPEECVQIFPKSRAGTCQCKAGYVRTENDCVLDYDFEPKHLQGLTENVESVEKKKLVVTAEINLTDNEVTIKAFVKPLPSEGIKYQYDWSCVNQPSTSAAIMHQSEDEMHLSKLTEGLYTFKVSVSSDDAYGEAFVNAIVLSPSRINKPPQVVIAPDNQMIRLPKTDAVLDASSSTDDDEIVSFHWELQQGPLDYEPQLKDTPTLQLNDLILPGNYTFKLILTDSDNATSSSTANITVLEAIDYPPQANAGNDVIIRLPNNQVILNGTASADDYGITDWKWTRSAQDINKPVDMQDTRTPCLILSSLEEGMYTFILEVTDRANQSDSVVVHVFVKPPL